MHILVLQGLGAALLKKESKGLHYIIHFNDQHVFVNCTMLKNSPDFRLYAPRPLNQISLCVKYTTFSPGSSR